MKPRSRRRCLPTWVWPGLSARKDHLGRRQEINLVKLSSWAAGWAIGGILQLPHVISRSLEVAFGLSGFVLLYFFMRTAPRHEPIRD